MIRPQMNTDEHRSSKGKLSSPIVLIICVHLCSSVAVFFSSQAAHGQEPRDLGQLRGITGIEDVPPTPVQSSWPYWLALAAVLLVVAAVLISKLVRRRPATRAALPADIWALVKLDRIDAMKLSDAGAAERLHTLVSDVVRRYLERRFDLQAPRQTTIEFLETMRASPKLSTSQQELLREFLERCDLAKFARAACGVEECRTTAAMARRFVEETSLSRQTSPAAP